VEWLNSRQSCFTALLRLLPAFTSFGPQQHGFWVRVNAVFAYFFLQIKLQAKPMDAGAGSLMPYGKTKSKAN